MSKTDNSPVGRVVSKLGIKATAQLCEVSVQSIYRYLRSEEKGGTGGYFPTKPLRNLKKNAQLLGVELPAEGTTS